MPCSSLSTRAQPGLLVNVAIGYGGRREIADAVRALLQDRALRGVSLEEVANVLDAEHIATATVARADLVVSWNFKHIVQFERIRGYNAVNLKLGYPTLAIHNPREVTE